MILTFQIIMLIVIVLSFITALGVDGENGQKAAGLCFASILAFTAIILWA